MCGITGAVAGRGEALEKHVLEAMTATLARRGPDAAGFFIDAEGGCGLGHRRLSIIDLAGGNQPLAAKNGAVQVVVNGEIYNYRALRKELQSRGYIFETESDSEVVGHGYVEWGPDLFERIDGMFALAIWDRDQRHLWLARDRMGKKPLYYAPVGEGLIFGSELKALMAHPRLERTVDPAGLAAYLTYECLPEDLCILKGVKKVLPGQALRFHRDTGAIETHTFWSLRFADSPEAEWVRGQSEEAIAERLREYIRGATAARLMSDVPLGVFLSGGIDSSTVAAAMAQVVPPKDIQTFSITFEDRSFDEGPHARRVAKFLGTSHHEQQLSPKVLLDILPDVASFMCEPLGDGSLLPTTLLSRFARQQVTVALGGDGGDELFLGYPTFIAQRVASALDRIVTPRGSDALGRAVMGAARLLPVSRKNFSFDFKVKKFAEGLHFTGGHRHQAWMGSFNPRQLAAVLHPDIRATALARHPYDLVNALRTGTTARDEDDLAMLQYARLYLCGDVLVKVDRASMSCGLEVRAPLLDTKVVELAAALPGHLKVRRGTTKYILKRAVRPWLPPDIIERPKKGFGVPIAEWLRGPLRPLARDLLSPRALGDHGLLESTEVTRLVDEHERGVADHRKPLWTLLSLCLWLRHFGEGSRRVPEATPEPITLGNRTPQAAVDAHAVDANLASTP